MSTHKNIDKICCVVVALALILTVLFMNGESLGIQIASRTKGYESRLFDTSTVHTIDIVMDDWEGFLESCTDEEYVLCSVVIDNEAYKNVAIRAKGNTSLSQVASYGNDRYSFKIEFDHYDSTKSYYGLDKLSLNNIIQDNTYMKDYLTYRMMGYFGVDAPLCSYVYITVNGEEWGLYLAVEGVEESFLERNYGSDYGELYKPDSQSMGGGRGNGGGFNMDDWQQSGDEDQQGDTWTENPGGMQFPDTQSWQDGFGMEQIKAVLNSLDDTTLEEIAETLGYADAAELLSCLDTAESVEELLNGKDISELASLFASQFGGRTPGMGDDDGQMPDMGGGMDSFGGSMGSDDVSLIYSDDEYSSYQNIFDNAKTDITDEDKDRLIASLKQLNEGTNIEEVVNVEEVIRYFVVHNFVCNFDSYTGSMIHNYYLYEEDGQLSMIPWDYNLAFGGFQSAQDATELVNYPIDTPVSGGTVDSRPMLAWIFASEEYTELYHQYFSEFIESCFDSGYVVDMIESVQEMISPYVEKDPTKFCTYEEFETGIETLKEFCQLRAESIKGQLDGTIASTSDGQSADSDTLIDASHINISDMGTMNNSMGGGAMGGGRNGSMEMPGNGEMEMPGRGGGMGGFDSTENAQPPQADTQGQQEDAQTSQGDMPDVSDGVSGDGGLQVEAETDRSQSDAAPSISETGDNQTEAESAESDVQQEGQIPNDMPEGNAFTDRSGSMPDNMNGADTQSADGWIMLGICGIVLAAGILAVALYRKKS